MSYCYNLFIIYRINHNSLELIAEILIITNFSQSPISLNSLQLPACNQKFNIQIKTHY